MAKLDSLLRNIPMTMQENLGRRLLSNPHAIIYICELFSRIPYSLELTGTLDEKGSSDYSGTPDSNRNIEGHSRSEGHPRYEGTLRQDEFVGSVFSKVPDERNN